MIWISLLSFLIAAGISLVLVRHFTEHSIGYADGVPQRFFERAGCHGYLS